MKEFQNDLCFYIQITSSAAVICLFVCMCTPMKACEKVRSWQLRGLLFYFSLFVCVVIFVGKQIGGLFIFTFFSLRRNGEDQPEAHHLGTGKAQCTTVNAGRLWNFLISHTSSSPIQVPCWIEGSCTLYSHENFPERTQS